MTKKSIYKSVSGKAQIQDFYDKLLKTWPGKSNYLWVKTKYGKTFVIERGERSKPVVVLLHGTASNSAMWGKEVSQLSVQYHVLAIDIIGECGKSDEVRLELKGEGHSEWLLEILNKLRIEKVTLIGCSLGGGIALGFSIKYPEFVENMVLIATAGVVPVRTSMFFLLILTVVSGKWGFNKLNKIVYGSEKIDKTALGFASLVKAYFKPRKDILPVFTNEQFRKIKARILFIGGDKDCFYNSYKARGKLLKELKNVQAYVLKNTGHVVTGQGEKIVEFLEG